MLWRALLSTCDAMATAKAWRASPSRQGKQMQLEWVQYFRLGTGPSIEEVRKRLPEEIKRSLMHGWKHTDSGIYVESAKTEVINYLDKRLAVAKCGQFIRYSYLEADANDIDHFDYFFIEPSLFRHHRDVFFEMALPTCTDRCGCCPSGARIASTWRIKKTRLGTLDFGEITRFWQFRSIELVVSSRLKRLFDAHEVSGLEYERCDLSNGDVAGEASGDSPYIARIVPETQQWADDIVLRTYCRTHNAIMSYDVFNVHTSRNVMPRFDFVLISGVRVGSNDYYYSRSGWVVSRKILRLLLENKVRGLRQATVMLQEKFRPLPVE